MLATSIDGAEHDGILKGVMAVAPFNREEPVANAARRHDQTGALIDSTIRRKNAPLMVEKIATSGRPR